MFACAHCKHANVHIMCKPTHVSLVVTKKHFQWETPNKVMSVCASVLIYSRKCIPLSSVKIYIYFACDVFRLLVICYAYLGLGLGLGLSFCIFKFVFSFL